MNLNEVIDGLTALRFRLAAAGVEAADVQVVVWETDGDLASVTDLDYDRFEDDGPWLVEIRKADDP